MQTKSFVRLRSSRAPYTRGGISFRSTREPVEIERGLLTDEQLAKLKADAVIRVEEFEQEIDPELPAGGEMHIVQPADVGSLAPQATGVTLAGAAAAAGATTTDPLPLDRMAGAIVDQVAPAGGDPLPPGGVDPEPHAAEVVETAEAVDGAAELPASVAEDVALTGMTAEDIAALAPAPGAAAEAGLALPPSKRSRAAS